MGGRYFNFNCSLIDIMTPNKQPEANTPDTEWQRTFLNAGTEKGLGDLSMMISVVSELLSSRDTYWKERVRKNLLKATSMISFTNEQEDILFEMLTNKDNLK